ncbi:MAG: response regulator [Pseudomonadota bacterium]
MSARRTIGIVDDDDALRDSLGLLLRFRDYDVVEFSSGEALLAASPPPPIDCLILDLRMRNMNGLDVLDACRAKGLLMPIIVVSAFGDVSSTKRALKSGAFDFLEKPIHEEQMLRVIEDALAEFDQAMAQHAEQSSLDERVQRLTGREKQILDAVLLGRHNREIAGELNISVRTVEVYKSRMMEKMQVTRLAELVRLFARTESR